MVVSPFCLPNHTLLDYERSFRKIKRLALGYFVVQKTRKECPLCEEMGLLLQMEDTHVDKTYIFGICVVDYGGRVIWREYKIALFMGTGFHPFRQIQFYAGISLPLRRFLRSLTFRLNGFI